jgi:hypothetical protein
MLMALFIILQIGEQRASGRQKARQTANEKTGLQLRSLREAFWAGAFFLMNRVRQSIAEHISIFF